jgi:hypothetical protein
MPSPCHGLARILDQFLEHDNFHAIGPENVKVTSDMLVVKSIGVLLHCRRFLRAAKQREILLFATGLLVLKKRGSLTGDT